MKKQSLIQKSIQKKQKLSTGVTNLSSYGVKLSPHIKKKINKINNLKKEKEKNAFPCEKGGEEDQHRRPPVNPPNLSTGGVKNMKNAFGGVGFSFSGKSGKKKEV